MESVYVADPHAETKAPRIEGEVPSPFNIPDGCVFENRCEYAGDICRTKRPELLEALPGEFVACHFPFLI